MTTTRRDLLKFLAYGSAGVAASGVLPACTSAAKPGSAMPPGGSGTNVPTGDRILVLVELSGGNDGLSTIVPIENGRYHDLRPTLALEGKDVITGGNGWDSGWGVNAKLAGLHRRGVAAVAGVGTAASDLSHFEMQARWAAGSPRTSPTNRTGFLGRLCDQIQGDELLTGVSMSMGMAPALISDAAGTTGLQDAEGLGLLQGDDNQARAIRQMLDRFAGAASPGSPGAGIAAMLRIVDMLGDLPETSSKYPDTEFSHQLAFASRLIRADEGIRVIHVPMAGGNFDTHDDHLSTHAQAMELLGNGLDAFLDDLERHDLANRVLIATTSEFGRRPEEHKGGLDHGTASSMLLLGPVTPGLHGEPSSLRKFDSDDNLVPTVEFDRYLATLATWMDIDPAAVLDVDTSNRAPRAIEGVLV